MAELLVPLYSQEGVDGDRLQSHQWAEVPAEISIAYMSGGLKKVRRMVERYFSYRFSPNCKRVQARWHGGEPVLKLRWFRVPCLHGMTLLHLGRLRTAGTVDIYRGYLEILSGDMLDPQAIAAPKPWPADMPWVAPSAGEFNVQLEHQRPPYLGTFEVRVQRAAHGCKLHTVLQDFPPVRQGLEAKLWEKPWQPMRRPANLDFLEQEIEPAARAAGHVVRFQVIELPGVPERLPGIYAREHLSPA